MKNRGCPHPQKPFNKIFGAIGMKDSPFVKIRVCLHIPTPSPFPSKAHHCANVTGRLTGRMGSTPILPIRQPVTIGTMIKLDGNRVGNGDGVGMCKRGLNWIISSLFGRNWLSSGPKVFELTVVYLYFIHCICLLLPHHPQYIAH